ncbi:apoptosis-associated speck-like protein containing a CARD [Spinachia spinachia]
MPPKSRKTAIKEALADLPKDDFEAFCHALRDRPGEPKVPYNKVEGKSFLVIADVLVAAFTEARAIEVTAELLEEICCEGHAVMLRDKTSGRSSQASSSNSAAAGGNTAVRGRSAEADFVDEHRTALVDRVNSVAPILDDLLAEGVVSQAINDEILDITNSRPQMRKLYSALNAAGCEGKEVFYKSLQKHEKYLIKDLLNNH